MKIRTVYLAGGINGLSDAEAKGWREQVKTLLPREVGVLDPMSRDYRGLEDANVREIVEGDLSDIRECQAIIAYCPRPSWGTAMEIQWSHTNRAIKEYRETRGEYGEELKGYVTIGHRQTVAIVPNGTPVSPWLRHHVDAIVATIEGAALQVIEWGGFDSVPGQPVRSEGGASHA